MPSQCLAKERHPEEPGLEIRDYLDGDLRREMINEVRSGLSGRHKSLPPKYFYDAEGSRLFEAICATPEYYPTRMEMGLLENFAASIMEFFAHEGGDLVELGSGSDRKVRLLLDAVEPSRLDAIRYVPFDICASALRRAAHDLMQDYHGLSVLGLAADFTRHLQALPQGRKLITFLGGSIGNFSESQAIAMLSSLSACMDKDDRFLLGMDMVKPKPMLEKAYNDSAGVTRRFNLNILHHINRELDGDLDPGDFEHLAFFNQEKEQIEMHLKAVRQVRASIGELGMVLEMEPDQTIHTEISRKFTSQSAERQFRQAGLRARRWLQDEKVWFSLVELEKA